MPITSLEIKDKTFGTRFRGFDPEEVDEFLISLFVTTKTWFVAITIKRHTSRVWKNVCLTFDEMKDSLSQSVLIAQDTAERVKQAAQERSNNIFNKLNKMLSVCLKKRNTRQMKFSVRLQIMRREWLLRQKS